MEDIAPLGRDREAMTDIQQAITRLCAADEHHPDFWQTLTDRDADPQMIRDVVAVARAYVRKETRAQHALQIIEKWSLYETAKDDHKYIANKAAEGLGE